MSVFKVISGAYVDFLFTIDLDGGFIYHWFLAVSLYGALVFFPAVAGGFRGCVGVGQHFPIMGLYYSSHVFCAAI